MRGEDEDEDEDGYPQHQMGEGRCKSVGGDDIHIYIVIFMLEIYGLTSACVYYVCRCRSFS